jgi:two-component system cell cycle sensor histidine kinase/response regulator CckA
MLPEENLGLDVNPHKGEIRPATDFLKYRCLRIRIIYITFNGVTESFAPGFRIRYGDKMIPNALAELSAEEIREAAHALEHKEAATRLRESEESYRRLFETAQDGILILEADGGHIADANPYIAVLLEYSREELRGMQLWEIGFFLDIESARGAFRTLKEHGYIHYDNLPLKTKTGKTREVEFVSNTYSVGEHRVIQCNIRDISDRKRAEKALLVSEESLRQARKLEAMGKLSAGVAHDFNNMLTVIIAYADIGLSMEGCPAPLLETFSEILKAGERAAGLTKQLLAFSRQQILAPKILGLNAVVSDMQEMLARLIGATVRLRPILTPELGCVQADLVQMQQILMNLVINASDSMPGGGEITITTANADLDAEYAAMHPEAAPDDYVLLSVRDTGAGMDAEVKSHIFDPFFTTKAIGHGTGMGLATVHGIVEQSGGHIMVESSPGKGSTFRIYLPRTDKVEEHTVNVPSSSASTVHGTETILLVEDDEMVRTLLRSILEKHGYKVLTANDGFGALALNQTHGVRIDLLLTDISMPGLEGEQLGRTFIHMRPGSQVLFMSGHMQDSAAFNGVIGKECFLQKPFTPQQLVMIVREILDKKPPPPRGERSMIEHPAFGLVGPKTKKPLRYLPRPRRTRQPEGAYGADCGTRTRDPLLGKQKLYQLS